MECSGHNVTCAAYNEYEAVQFMCLYFMVAYFNSTVKETNDMMLRQQVLE